MEYFGWHKSKSWLMINALHGDMRQQIISCRCIDYVGWLCVYVILYKPHYGRFNYPQNTYNRWKIIIDCALIYKWFSGLIYHEITQTWSPFGSLVSWDPLSLLLLVSCDFLKHAPLVVGDMTFLLLTHYDRKITVAILQTALQNELAGID